MLTRFAVTRKRSLLLATAALILTAGTLTIPTRCLAQYGGRHPGYHPPAPHITWYHHASTAREGHLRGLADLQRAVGERRRNEALAHLYLADAKRQQIRNRHAYVVNYFEIKQVNREARYGSRDRSASLAKRKAETKTRVIAKRTTTRSTRIPVQVFNSATGNIQWPVVLRGRVFSSERDQLDKLFASHREPSGSYPTISSDVDHLAERVLEKLRGNVRELPTKEYLAAKQFLVALKAAARDTSV